MAGALQVDLIWRQSIQCRLDVQSFDHSQLYRAMDLAAGHRYAAIPLLRRVNIMNNSDLADTIAAAHDFTKTDARKLVDAIFATIADAAAKGEEISLNGFGKFKVKETPAREGRNPSTGASIQIAAARKLAFAPAKAVKDKLNG
jgi:DNA-binding protein HU-beta